MVWYGQETNLKWTEERVIGVELMKELLQEFFCNQSSQMGLVMRWDMASSRWEVGG